MIYILTKNAKAIIGTLVGVGIVGGLIGDLAMVHQDLNQMKQKIDSKPAMITVIPTASPSATLSPTQGVKVFKYSPLPLKSVIVK